ncbi:MAG: Uma2 family endonuclease [Cyanobacteria bacterium P01_C01_bin.89]
MVVASVTAIPTVAISPDSLIIPSGGHVVFQGVTWEQFEAIALAFGYTSGYRLAYDNEKLEIMVPLPEHEYFKSSLSDLVKDIADELDMDYACYGSTTWRQHLKKMGVEADDCFYIQNEATVRGRTDLDTSLKTDPPPDLVLEIDVTSKSLARFPIYAQLGVPEIWRYDEGKLEIYELVKEGIYQQRETSLALPKIPAHELPDLIEQHRSQGQRAIRKTVRQWAAQFRPSEE